VIFTLLLLLTGILESWLTLASYEQLIQTLKEVEEIREELLHRGEPDPLPVILFLSFSPLLMSCEAQYRLSGAVSCCCCGSFFFFCFFRSSFCWSKNSTKGEVIINYSTFFYYSAHICGQTAAGPAAVSSAASRTSFSSTAFTANCSTSTSASALLRPKRSAGNDGKSKPVKKVS
jgi:hypothetical protein